MQQRPGAGWLERTQDGAWHVTPCDWRRVRFAEVAELAEANEEEWREFDLERKHERLGTGRRVHAVILSEDDASLDLNRLDEPGTRTVEATLVLAGPAVGKKCHETIFFDPMPSRRFPVADRLMSEFEFVHTRPGKDRREAEGNWAYWRPRAEHQPIPVFFVGESGSSGSATTEEHHEFHLGLTRLFRLPHRHTVGRVAENSQDASPDMALDFTEAVFGRVSEQAGLKTRVFFETAVCANNDRVKLLPPFTTTLLGPRASFGNYILDKARI